MEFKVFDSSKKAKPEVFFKLERNSLGGIRLLACDGEGNRLPNGYILEITYDGYLYCNSNVNDTIGLKLDSDGRII